MVRDIANLQCDILMVPWVGGVAAMKQSMYEALSTGATATIVASSSNGVSVSGPGLALAFTDYLTTDPRTVSTMIPTGRGISIMGYTQIPVEWLLGLCAAYALMCTLVTRLGVADTVKMPLCGMVASAEPDQVVILNLRGEDVSAPGPSLKLANVDMPDTTILPAVHDDGISPFAGAPAATPNMDPEEASCRDSVPTCVLMAEDTKSSDNMGIDGVAVELYDCSSSTIRKG
ncbi:hypothetical protein KIPB_006648 [Kipferlia bialata]|uniref:Uncharacterized protein n=2 Tax=Kipferlia bialata TaxID=797122 RepID=A0A9K3CXB1_9EUKA|nr:hypothetical protein KIPB_006648 [Kipferlia bialata]|eukprot:g6648.t1